MRFLSTFDLDSALEGQGRQRDPVAQAHPDPCCMRMRAERAFSELEKVFGLLTVKVRKRRPEVSGTCQNPLRAVHHARRLLGMVGTSGSDPTRSTRSLGRPVRTLSRMMTEQEWKEVRVVWRSERDQPGSLPLAHWQNRLQCSRALIASDSLSNRSSYSAAFFAASKLERCRLFRLSSPRSNRTESSSLRTSRWSCEAERWPR